MLVFGWRVCLWVFIAATRRDCQLGLHVKHACPLLHAPLLLLTCCTDRPVRNQLLCPAADEDSNFWGYQAGLMAEREMPCCTSFEC